MRRIAERRQRGPAPIAAAFVAIGALLASGCDTKTVDKAGGSAPPKPIVLTLATHDQDYAFANFASAVGRVSGGSLRIRIANDWRHAEIDYERGIIDDVRSGKVALGIVGVRVLGALGITSFDALVAPLLIDSLDLEARALRSEFAHRALARVSRRGIVGIAVLPGFLRRPFGITRRLVQPLDYRGTTIGIRPGRVANATFEALGATARGYAPGDVSGLDGVELDLPTISGNAYDRRGRALTGNVVLWPKPQVIVMNQATYDRLSSKQRQVLRRAARAALSPELKRAEDEEKNARSLLCSAGAASIVTATPADVAALWKAVRPVYRVIERDPLTNGWLAEIRQLRANASSGVDSVRCR